MCPRCLRTFQANHYHSTSVVLRSTFQCCHCGTSPESPFTTNDETLLPTLPLGSLGVSQPADRIHELCALGSCHALPPHKCKSSFLRCNNAYYPVISFKYSETACQWLCKQKPRYISERIHPPARQAHLGRQTADQRQHDKIADVQKNSVRHCQAKSMPISALHATTPAVSRSRIFFHRRNKLSASQTLVSRAGSNAFE